MTCEQRYQFIAGLRTWDTGVPKAVFLRDLLLEMLADWGTGLELPLYEEAVGRQDFRHVAENVAFKLTAFEDDASLDNFEKHARRLNDHTSLEALIWANIGGHVVTFSTLRAKR